MRARSQPPSRRGSSPLPKHRRMTCSANRKHRANIASIESASEGSNRPVAFAHFACFDYSFGLNKFVSGGKDHAFSCAVFIVHFPDVYTRGLLEEASRHGIQLRQPRHGGAVECCRWKCDE